MTNIESKFSEAFAYWGIRLPAEDLSQRKRGKIVQSGWAIWYLFGSKEEGEYLDYYASHRMTDDRHIRIYEDGRCEDLPAIGSVRLRSDHPEEDARLEADYFAENRRIGKLLEEKGFGLGGDEPGGIQINRHLHLSCPEE
jgi:hypothetical protein